MSLDGKWSSLAIFGFLLLPPASSAQVADGSDGYTAGRGLVTRLRLTTEILDSQPAILEADVRDDARPFHYSVDWGDGSQPEVGRRTSQSSLKLDHDYDLISTFRVTLSITSGKESTTLEAGLVSVADDDNRPPHLEWSLPPPVVRPGEPAVVGWNVTDESGLDYIFVTIQGPDGPIERFEQAEGQVDLGGRGLGSFAVEIRTGDADHDRPGDELGYMLIEIVTVTDDLDSDGILDYLDNCPREANPDQSDGDHDGLGDRCDPCPEINGRCPPEQAIEPTVEDSSNDGTAAGILAVGFLLCGAFRFRRNRRTPWLAVTVTSMASLLAASALAAPVISSIRPAATLVGERVVIRGTGFGASQGVDGRVTFGGVDAGTVYHWTDARITVEVPVGFLVGNVPTPTPAGVQPVVVRNSAGEVSASVDIDIKIFNALPPFRAACRCGDAGCVGPCLPNDYCRQNVGGCNFDGTSYGWRDIKDVDFGDVDDDGDLDVIDVSSPMRNTAPAGVVPGYSPTGCGDPVNFPDRLFLNDGLGRYSDVTGGADGNYATGGDNPLPFFHSFRTYDADFVDVNNDGYLDYVRADRTLCGADPAHYFINDGLPQVKFHGRAMAVPTVDAYWDNLATGDLEGDGDLDLLVSHSATTTARHALEINDGSGTFTLYDPATMAPTHAADDDFTSYQTSSHDMALVDLDGDRDQDILLGGGNHVNSLANQVLLNRFAETGEIYFESVPIPRAAETSATIHVGAPDLNGDGRPDAHFVNDRDLRGPADRLFLNLGRIDCTPAAEAACGDGLRCADASLTVANRICWRDATSDLPEAVAGILADGYGADYGDVDADGDLDILVTGISSSGNYLFVNRAGTTCAGAADCPAGYTCVSGGCRPSTAATTPKWWSCPAMGSGPSAVPCRDRSGATITGTRFPAARQDRRSLSVVFGDVDGDVDLDVLWARGQWGPSDWAAWPDAGPLLLIGDGEHPYVKKVTVYSGPRIVYQAAWAPNAAGTELVLAPATFAAAAPFTALRTQDVHIEVEFNEPMATASLSVAPALGPVPVPASSQPLGGQTVWRTTLSNLDIADDGSEDGTYTININGQDLVGNDLLRISSRTNIAVGAIRSGTTGQDTIHGFRVGPLAGAIPVTALFMKQGATDPAMPTIAGKSLDLQNALDAYFDEVSYGEISFAVTGHGWYRLDHARSWYETLPRTLLVDLVQEAIDDARADGVDLSSGYVLVVTEETATDEWSTSGGWPYTVGGGPQLIASGLLDLATSNARLTHLAGRLVGLVDLFAHPEVVVTRPFVGPYSHMSDKNTEVHPLGWEKWRAGWIDQTGTATGKQLTRVAIPPPGSPIAGQTHTLIPLDSDTDGVKMVAIELADSLHFTAEYRRRQNLDTALPDAGVLLVKTNDLVAQGEGPAIVLESPVTAGDLSDAPFVVAAPRQRFDDVGSGVGIEVLSIDAAQARIRLDYEVPPTQNDLYVERQDDHWKTEDIWVDAPDLAGNFAADPRTVRNADERPVVGRLNKVIGRVRNRGRADATNFEVELEILEPWGTGGPWRSLKVEPVLLLQGQDTNPGADYLIVADWTPTGDVHSCVRLRIRGAVNDISESNNETQENIHEFDSTRGSPYSPVTSRFQVENPFDESIPVLFRLDGLPVGWTSVIVPERPVLAPKATTTAQITVQPAEGAPLCSREEVTLTAWAPRVDTLKRLGGLTLAIQLMSPASITSETRYDCKQGSGGVALGHDAVAARIPCTLVTRGCTDPGLPNTEVAVVYTAPDGSAAVRYVTTDEDGCFADVVPGATPGLWQVETVLEEEECRQGDRTPATPVFVPPPFGVGFGDQAGRRHLGVFAGGNWPLADLDDYSASFLFAGHLEWDVTSSLRLGVQLGYHAFDAEPAAGVANLGITNLSAIGRWRGGGTVIRPFVLGGLGGYEADGHWDPGVEAGVGFEVPLSSSVSLAAGLNAHVVDRSGTEGTHPSWTEAYLGFFVALP